MVLRQVNPNAVFNGNCPARVASEADLMPRVIEVTKEALRAHAENICIPTKVETRKNKKTGELVEEHFQVKLPIDVSGLYLFGLEGEWNLKPLRGIATIVR